jgi:hypothetical protein
VQGKKRLLKKRSPQHNKPTNPNNEVPPQDAQLQGVVSMASTQLQTQTVKCLHKMRNFKGLSKWLQNTIQRQMKVLKRRPPRASAQLKMDKDKASKASKGKRCATS